MTAYTLIRHSAWTVRRDPVFQHAVEFVPVPSAKMEARIAAAGGLVLADYATAQTAEYDANYPAGTEGLVPKAPGTFVARVRIGVSEMYRPPVAVTP